MANRSTRLQYEDFDQACPDLSPSFENFDTESLHGNEGYFTFYVPEGSKTDQLELWMGLLDAAWAVRQPLAGASEQGIYHVLRSVMNEAAFDIENAALAEYCKIICFKLGVRCDPNFCCAHYQQEHGRRTSTSSEEPGAQFFKRSDEPRCYAPNYGPGHATTSAPPSSPVFKKPKPSGFPASFGQEPASTSGVQKPPVFKMTQGPKSKAPMKMGSRAN